MILGDEAIGECANFEGHFRFVHEKPAVRMRELVSVLGRGLGAMVIEGS